MRCVSMIFACLHFPKWRRHQWLAVALGLGASVSALADTTTLTAANATAYASSGPVTMQFPVTRSGDLGYEAVLNYHTVDGTAHAGVDYAAASGMITLPAGVASATIPVTLSAQPSSGASPTFQLQLDSAIGVGPAPNFADQQTFATGLTPYGVTSADVNGDGKPDLIVTNSGANNVSVLLSTSAPGATAPSFATQQTFATGPRPTSVTAADINGDGKPDLIVANSTANTVSVLLNTTARGATTPSFAAQQVFATGPYPSSVTAADVNGDGRPDLIVTNFGDTTVTVLPNGNAPGATTLSFDSLQYQMQIYTTFTSPVCVTVADVNGDGKPDLIVSNGGGYNAVSVLLNISAPGATTPNFAAQQTFATGSFPRSVSAADVNGDGKPDLIVANSGDGTVSVLLNTTTPGAATLSFAPQQTFAMGTGTAPVSVSATDVNGDGRPDLILANPDTNTVSVLLNTTAPGATTPSFAAQQIFVTGTNPQSVSAADVNGDGKPDLVAANSNDNTVSVLLDTTAPGATTPGFAAQQTFATGTNPRSVITADVNGDGKRDLIVTNYLANSVSVLLNTNAPGATTPSFAVQQAFATGSGPQSVSAADVNGDGMPDLIVANANDGTVSVLFNTTPLGDATLSFAPQQTFATGSSPYSVTAADVDGDGRPDLIVANSNDNTVSVLLNTTVPGATAPTFAAQQTFATGANPVSVFAADINGDGQPDLIVANGLDNTVSVLLNTTVPGAVVLSFAAQQIFATGTRPQSVTAVDVNGDGKLDLIVANDGTDNVSVLFNTTAAGAAVPSFATQQAFVTGSRPQSVTAADVNGDGKPDLIAANYGSNTVSVLLNTQYQALFAGSPATGTIVHTYTVTATVAGANGTIKLPTQGVVYGSQAIVTITPDSGYHAVIDPSTTCPAGGSLSGGIFTTGNITADCTIVVAFVANPPTALTITVTDNLDYARYGGSLSYIVAVTNTGIYDAATGVALSNTLPAQIDAADTHWTCIGAGNGAACPVSGNGDLNPTGIVIPAGRTLYWQVTAQVLAQASGDTIDYAVSAIPGDGGATVSATDSDTLVIFRGGFDVANADGAQGIEPQAALVAPQFP